MYGCAEIYPLRHWGPALKLANGQLYRFEYYVHYVDATHIQVHPRVYNAAGALIPSDAHFLQEDYLAGGTPNRRQDRTLAAYYAGGGHLRPGPAGAAPRPAPPPAHLRPG